MPEYWDNIRIQNLHGTEAEWENKPNFKPEAGEIVIYDPDDTYKSPRMKVGNGSATLGALQFASSDKIAVSVTTGTATIPTRKEYTIAATDNEDAEGAAGVITFVLYEIEGT